MTRSPVRPVSLPDLRRIAETLASLVVGVDSDEGGRPQLEVDVIRPPAEQGNQLEVRFESA